MKIIARIGMRSATSKQPWRIEKGDKATRLVLEPDGVWVHFRDVSFPLETILTSEDYDVISETPITIVGQTARTSGRNGNKGG